MARTIGGEFGFIGGRPSGPAKAAATRSAVEQETRHLGEPVREARIQIAQQFEAYRAGGGIPGLFEVPQELRQASNPQGPGAGSSPGNYLLPQGRPFAPQGPRTIEDDEAGIGVPLTVIL